MIEITTLFTCLHPLIGTTQYRQLLLITNTLLAMTGRITMLGMSRWAGKGGSYRTIQRFFMSSFNWEALNWAIIKTSFSTQGVMLVAGDATTVTKSGKATHGLGRFFSSIYSRPVPGIAFQTLSLIDVDSRSSWPLVMEQMLSETKRTKPTAPLKKTKKQSKGRPKGVKNKNHRDVTLNAEMLQVKAMLKRLLRLTEERLQLIYFVYDGAFGNNAAVQMTHQVGLKLISKLRHDSALYFKYTGAYSGKGRRRTYGNRVNYDKLPEENLISVSLEDHICTRTYQLNVLHKKFADPLNVLIILKENQKTKKKAHVILFSTDLDLDGDKLVDYYRLRFQIEFNFRDAKQHWGLEDFMVVKQQSVFNAANLSLFMVNVSQALLARSEDKSILDLKARYHGFRYAQEVFKILPENTKPINIMQLFEKIPVLGRIHEETLAA